jgi:hypothetical protein
MGRIAPLEFPQSSTRIKRVTQVTQHLCSLDSSGGQNGSAKDQKQQENSCLIRNNTEIPRLF